MNRGLLAATDNHAVAPGLAKSGSAARIIPTAGSNSHTDLTNQADEAQLGDPEHTPKGCRSTTRHGVSTLQGGEGNPRKEERHQEEKKSEKTIGTRGTNTGTRKRGTNRWP